MAQLSCESAAATDRGRVRTANEDAFGLSREDGVFLVCDGMGGAAAGEVASGMAVSVFLKRLAGWAKDEETRRSPASRLQEAIVLANRAIYCKAAKDFRLHGMGTTLVALAIEGDSAWVAHVGDSRCYRWRRGALEQCTLDHSLVEEQVRMGAITEEEAARSPLRNVITRAVGSQRTVTADIEQLPVEPGDLFVLCSDGLTGELSAEEMGSILAQESDLGSACAKLIGAANKSGGRDNITCLLVRIGKSG